ncbi:MAG: hypothetical protein Q8O76_02215 [Chloroflexota bacterium]|nr:hypothetical protein [Chloroflexota bacterium]
MSPKAGAYGLDINGDVEAIVSSFIAPALYRLFRWIVQRAANWVASVHRRSRRAARLLPIGRLAGL